MDLEVKIKGSEGVKQITCFVQREEAGGWKPPYVQEVIEVPAGAGFLKRK